MNEFKPDYCVAPGEYLRECMEMSDAHHDAVTAALGMTDAEIDSLLDGRMLLTEAIAAKLDCATGVPARLWFHLERQYREDLKMGLKDLTSHP